VKQLEPRPGVRRIVPGAAGLRDLVPALVPIGALVALLAACGNNTAVYADDEHDPIPYVGKIDGVVATNQGLYYLMTISSPLDASSRSLRRLQAKCANYLKDFRSRETQADLARRGAGSKHIDVYLNPGSSPKARQALMECGEKARAEGVDFHLRETLPAK
jgi:hypothetical protein